MRKYSIQVLLTPLRYCRLQIGCVFAEYDLFKSAIFIPNLVYTDFCINLTQFCINYSRQEHRNICRTLMGLDQLRFQPIPPFIFPLQSL